MVRARKDAGLNVEYQAMDWSTLVSRRAKVKTGGWHCHMSIHPGQNDMPTGPYFLTSPYYHDGSIQALREEWIDAPDAAAERRIARQIQLRFFEKPPTLLLGQYYYPSAYCAGVSDIARAPWALFSGYGRGSIKRGR